MFYIFYFVLLNLWQKEEGNINIKKKGKLKTKRKKSKILKMTVKK